MGNPNVQPSSRGMLIPGARGKLLANCYLPGGPGPYPVVLLCHGIPGIERLMDFAVALRESGFAAVCFHYSGCFGSDGDYAVSHCMEDSRAVLDYILSNPFGDYDADRVFLLGHSMGGLMAARTAALASEVKAACIMAPMDFRLAALEALEGREGRYKALIDVSAPWVHGLSWESFTADARAHIGEMDLISYAPALSQKPVLTVVAGQDALLPKEDHIDRLNAAIECAGGERLEKRCFDSDHSFNSDRPAVRDTVCDFFRRQL